MTAVEELGRPPLSEERRALIADMLQSAGAVTIGDLQARFGISSMTARRDLTILEERGIARRTHGGAVLPPIASGEHSFRQRLRDAPDAKRRLAEAAVSLLAPGQTVFLDASSTTYFAARLIAERSLPVRVITNSLPVLNELSGSENAETDVVAIGGTFRRVPCSYVGPAAVRAIRDHFADWLLMSVAGIADSGVMTDLDVLEAEVKRSMLQQAERSVLLLDRSKLTARGSQAIAPVARVSLVLADNLPAEASARLEALGATVRATELVGA